MATGGADSLQNTANAIIGCFERLPPSGFATIRKTAAPSDPSAREWNQARGIYYIALDVGSAHEKLSVVSTTRNMSCLLECIAFARVVIPGDAGGDPSAVLAMPPDKARSMFVNALGEPMMDMKLPLQADGSHPRSVGEDGDPSQSPPLDAGFIEACVRHDPGRDMLVIVSISEHAHDGRQGAAPDPGACVTTWFVVQDYASK